MHRPQLVTWTTHTAEATTLLEATRLQKLYTYMCNIVTEFYLYSIVYIYLINSRLDVTHSVRHHFRTATLSTSILKFDPDMINMSHHAKKAWHSKVIARTDRQDTHTHTHTHTQSTKTFPYTRTINIRKININFKLVNFHALLLLQFGTF